MKMTDVLVRAIVDRQFAERLRHEPRLEANVRVAHFAFDFGAWHEGGHGVHNYDVNRVRTHERFADFQRLLTGLRLADEQVFEADAEVVGVGRVHGVLDIDVGGGAAEPFGPRP